MGAAVTAIANQKGGAGKTSLTIEVATALVLRANAKVLAIDADPQHGLIDWREDRETEPLFPVVGFPSDKLAAEVRAHLPNYDHIIIDAPPRNMAILRAAAICSHAMLIPVQPSKHDIRSTGAFVQMLQEALTFNPDLKAAFVINRRIAGTALGRDIFSALEEYPFPVLQTVIGQRVAFPEAHGFGLSVLEHQPLDAKAVSEVEELVVELLETLNHGQKDSTGSKKTARLA
ncbi:MAG: AAA family ATPase [Pseudomonadota bacterium]|nr:AAA family ATPase [Pseudomonadota bacterium]